MKDNHNNNNNNNNHFDKHTAKVTNHFLKKNNVKRFFLYLDSLKVDEKKSGIGNNH